MLCTVAAGLAGCAPSDLERLDGDLLEAPHIADFYELDEDVPAGDPGTLVKSVEIPGAPDGASAWRVIYRSTDLNGDPVLSSGLVVAPDSAAPAGGRPVVSWAHPTTGTARDCAPSMWIDPFLMMSGLGRLLEHGYVVTATDYTGLGVEGPDSYLIGVTEGHNVLDAVRAAIALPGTEASADTVMWGHSQGGQAALFAAALAPTYAPELTVHGAAVAAPAADLTSLLDAHLDDVSGVTIGSYAFQAYADVYGSSVPGATVESILTPAGVAALPELNELCLLTHLDELHGIADPLIGGFMSSDPSKTEPWSELLAENSVGAMPPGLPVFVAQGGDDKLVVPADTDAFVEGLRANGTVVTYEHFPNANHGIIGDAAVPNMVQWLGGLGVPGALSPGGGGD